MNSSSCANVNKVPKINQASSSSKSANAAKTRKRKIHDDPNQLKLVSFMSMNKNASTIFSDINDPSNMSNDISNTCEENSTYVLLFATNMDMKEIFIIIILVSEQSLPVKERPEDSIYVRARVNQGYYLGRVMMLSKKLQDLKASVKLARDKIKDFPGYQILRKKILISCTKPHDVMQLDSSDAREIFLRNQLNDRVQSNELVEDNLIDAEELELDDDFQVISNDEHSNMIINESLVSANNMSSISVMDQIDQRTNTGTMSDMKESQKTDLSDVYISSSEETEQESELQPKKKRQRIHDFTNPKMIARLREQRMKSAEETETNIVRAIEKLKEIIPTLSVKESTTIALKALFQLTMDLNSKMNCSKEEKTFSARIPLTRNISIKKISSKDQIKLGDKVTLPLKGYSKAIMAEKPCLIVSRIMRVCFDTSLKVGAKINDKFDDSNFLFRLGNKSLIGEERLNDGREILDLIIEHAHRLKNEDSMSLESLNACWAQIKKAIYDCKRRDDEKKSYNKQIANDDTSINEKNHSYESHSSASGLPDSVSFM